MKKYFNFLNEDKESEEKAVLRIRKAFAIIIAQWPFIADILIRLKIRIYPQCQTMATDGIHLLVNPDWMAKLTEQELNWVLCHEVLHNAFFHFARQIDRKPKTWNYASDYAINLLLEDLVGKFCKRPDGVLFDHRFDNMSAEEIYKILDDEKSVEDDGDGGGGDGGGGKDGKSGGPPVTGSDIYKPGFLSGKGKPVFDNEPKGPPSNSPEAVKKSIEETMKASANAGRTAGKGGGNLDRFIKGLNKPKVNWREELRDFVSRVYNQTKTKLPTRRSLWRDQPLYGLKRFTSDEFNNMVVAIDTSGSIGDEELGMFKSELSGIMKEYEIESIYIIWCDSRIPEGGIQKFEDYDFKLEKMVARGGGGTSFIPPFVWVNENLIDENIDPAVMIYFTDSYGDAPNANMLHGDLEDKLLWVIIGADSADHITVGKKIFVDKIE